MGGALLPPGITRIWHDLFFFPFSAAQLVAKRAYHRAEVDPIGDPLDQCARPQVNRFCSKVRVRHFQYDAARVLVSKEIVSRELQVIQGTLRVEEEWIPVPARKELRGSSPVGFGS
jgi:hypothetical protein